MTCTTERRPKKRLEASHAQHQLKRTQERLLMDPLSIAAGCVGIISGIKTTSAAIRGFVRDVREARHELGATARHLADLEMTINLIADDHGPGDGDTGRQIPESITAQTTTVIKSCRDILAELDALMEKHNPRRHRAPLIWALKGKDEALVLNRQIEAHTRTLTMALEISTLSVPLGRPEISLIAR